MILIYFTSFLDLSSKGFFFFKRVHQVAAFYTTKFMAVINDNKKNKI